METEGNGSNEIRRFCVDCKTTKTPLWRGGPAGPKSLCNACGIRQRKGKRVRIGIHNGVKKEIFKNRLDCSFRLKLLSSDIGGSLQRLLVSEQQRKWAEEEEAAALLVALSCGLFLKKQSC